MVGMLAYVLLVGILACVTMMGGMLAYVLMVAS